MPFETLKATQAEVWGIAPFQLVELTLSDMHDALVDALAPQAGETFLDVGCGTGAVAMRAVARGAKTTGVDIAPALVETAALRAHDRGLDIDYGVGDAEELPFADASFDVVGSAVGAIFAPDHLQTARELARVTKPGGRLALTAWKAESSVADMFRALAQFQPPPPEGAGSPLRWGEPAYARDLLGGDFELDFHDAVSVWEMPSPDAAWDLMSLAFGPLVALLRRLPERRADIYRVMAELAAPDYDGHRFRQERAYTLIVGRRR